MTFSMTAPPSLPYSLCYDNPLSSAGNYHRRRWFGCSCCPTNLIRFVPSVGGYAYATGKNTVYVNQFIPSESVIDMPEGRVCLLYTSRCV